MWRAEIESVIEPHHVFDSVDRDAAFADLPEDAIRIAVDAVKCGAVKRGAESLRALMPCEVMKTFVGVLSEHQSREQARRFLGLRDFSIRRARRSCFAIVFLEAFYLADWFE